MAKLADLMQQAAKASVAPLGFASARAKQAPTMITVAVIGKDWKGAAGDATSSGAAALLLTGGPSPNDVTAAVKAAGESPCGLVVSGAGGLSSLSDAGIDFVVLGQNAPAGELQTEGLTFLLQVDEEVSDIQLRTVDSLPIAALFLDTPPGAFTIGRQMELQRITGLARKPLLAAAPPDAQREDVLSLRDSGAMLLAVDMSSSGANKTLTGLNGLIDKLPARRSRDRGDKADVTLPTQSRGSGEHDEEDEE